MKKLIIFDLDGTLAHTQPLLNFIFADALTECGIPETEEHVRALVKEQGFRPTKDSGHAPVAYLDRIPDDFGFYFWSHYENYYMKAADRLYDGIRETLDELKSRGQEVDFEKLRAEIELRDKQDMEREFSPLVRADDAILVDTSTMTIEEVVAYLKGIIQSKI
jgi:beta-phosphoglucomutase-like phosphatase (HAD superfamily)